MKKTDHRKRSPLVLVRETLVLLSNKQLARAAGGSPVTGDPCLQPPEVTLA